MPDVEARKDGVPRIVERASFRGVRCARVKNWWGEQVYDR